MKLWMMKLERIWFVSAPDDLEEEEVLELSFPDFMNFDTKDVVQVQYWGDPNNYVFEPDLELEDAKNAAE